MGDPKKTAEIAKKIQDISGTVYSHESTINRIEREKNDKVKYYDQQISRAKDEITRIERKKTTSLNIMINRSTGKKMR